MSTIDHQAIDNAISKASSSIKELDSMLMGLYTTILGNYSYLSLLTYTMKQLKAKESSIKTKGIIDSARDFLGVTYDTANEKFVVNKNLTRILIADCPSILKYKGEKVEKDAEAELKKALRTLAKKAINLNWDDNTFLEYAVRAYQIEHNYLKQ